MKKVSLVFGLCIVFMCCTSLAEEATQIIERAALSSRTHEAWDGIYEFYTNRPIRIYGMTPLYALVYHNYTRPYDVPPASDGQLLDFAIPHGEDKLKIFVVADYAVKGIIPVLEDIYVFPGTQDAEIIVRWRHPGMGGYRTLEKYRYTGDSLVLINRSEFCGYVEDRYPKWYSESQRESIFSERAKEAERAAPQDTSSEENKSVAEHPD